MPTFHPHHPQRPAHLQGERKVLEAFQVLPSDTHVFVGVQLPGAGGLGLAFLMADPELGLVIVDVLPDGVEPRKGRWVRSDAAGVLATIDLDPVHALQARQNALFTFLKGAGLAFIPRITQVLALPSLTLEPGRALGPNLPACRLLTEDKLGNPYIALRLAVTGGRTWTEWSTTPLASQFAIGRATMDQLGVALRKVPRD